MTAGRVSPTAPSGSVPAGSAPAGAACVRCGASATGLINDSQSSRCDSWPGCTPAIWTVGQLRAALDGVPDEARVRVAYAVDEDSSDEQLVHHAGLDPTVWYRATQTQEPPHTNADAWFTLLTEFPPDDYLRGPH